LPSFSSALEHSLTRALAAAKERKHEYATLEHLLLTLCEDEDASAVMRACDVDVDELRETLLDYVERELASLLGVRNSVLVNSGVFCVAFSLVLVGSGACLWVLMDSGGFWCVLVGSGGFWFVLVDSGGFL
jgi:hypothetical protein